MKTFFTGLAMFAALMFSTTGCETNVVDDDPNVPNAEVETDTEEDVEIDATTPPTTTPPIDTTPSDPADNIDVNVNGDADAGVGTDTTTDPNATNP